MGINYVPGEIVTRAELNASYGGGIQGGILTPAGGRYAFVFTDAESGDRYGYTFDGWMDSSHQTFFYTGEGSEGDQTFRPGGKNKVLLDSVASGREIHIFEAVGYVSGSQTKKHCYLGQFRTNAEEPYRREDAPDRNLDNRSVIVFRFDAVSSEKTASATPDDFKPTRPPAALSGSTVVDTESGDSSAYKVKPTPATTAERREKELERSWQEHLRAQGHELGRQKITIAGQSRVLMTDTWDSTSSYLYEAKGTATREAIRMAIGQILDYKRHITPTPAATFILLPARPHDDLVSLMRSAEIGLVYQTAEGFVEVHHES
jgi:uncharacterized repeat protein (TIGR02543 family)